MLHKNNKKIKFCLIVPSGNAYVCFFYFTILYGGIYYIYIYILVALYIYTRVPYYTLNKTYNFFFTGKTTLNLRKLKT